MQGPGSPAHVNSERFPGANLLDDALPQITGKEQRFWTPGAKSSQESKLRHTHAVRLAHVIEAEQRRRPDGTGPRGDLAGLTRVRRRIWTVNPAPQSLQ